MSRQPIDAGVTQEVKLDAVCLRFEQAWRQDEAPQIETFLKEVSDAERSLLLPQLLLVELEHLERAKASPQIDDYLSRFPNDEAVIRRVFEEHARHLRHQQHSQPPGAVSFAENDPPRTTSYEPIAEGAGSRIDRYRLLEQIGEGGMGVVYMAEQQRPVRRKVALKIIKPGMDTKQVIARFEAERQALAIMDHTNIARVLDAGSTESGRPYFVMELVRGIPMTEYCDQNKLTTNERLELFVTVCQAVQHAHQKGIIHRDIKPTNVLVTLHDGVPVPKIIDFGVSKATNQQLTERTLFTAFAQMVGTPLYMSPEQAEMSGLDIDTRSDIYSLGVLLYELLTSATPFDKKRISTAAYDEVRRIIREEEPDKPSTRISSLGERSLLVCQQRKTDAHKLRQLLMGELDWIVMKALDKDRQRRYQTARGLAADVNRYLAGEPVEACPPTLAYRLSKFVKRYKAQAAVASLFLFLLVASSVVAWVLFVNARRAQSEALRAESAAVRARQAAERAAQETERERDRAEENLRRAQQQELKVATLAEERQRRLYDYTLIKAAAAYRQGEQLKTGQLLTESLPEQRGWEWHRLRRLTGRGRTLQLSETPFVTYAVSPTKRQIVTVDATGNYGLYDLDAGKEIMSRATGVGQPGWVEFSPAGRLFALFYGGGGTSMPQRGRLEIWEAAAGTKVWDFTSDHEVFVIGSFSADGEHLVFGGINPSNGEGMVYLVGLREPKLIWKQATPERGVPIPVFAPDSKHFYLILAGGAPGSVRQAGLRYWSIDGPQEVWSQSSVTTSLPCVTPDGSQLITGGPNHSLDVRNAGTGELIHELPGDRPDVAFLPSFSPDGRYLVSLGHLGHVLVRDWHTKRAVDSFTIPARERDRYLPLFSPDGDRFVVPSPKEGAIDFREVDPSPTDMTLVGHEQDVKGVSFSPDGKQVVSVSRDGTLRIWSAITGQELQTISAHTSAFDLAFAPQGNYIATGGSDGAKVWSVESGQLVHHLPETINIWWIDFSPDGKRIVTGGGPRQGKKFLSLFDVSSGRQLLSRETPEVTDGLVFCADGRRAVSVMYLTGQLDLWDLASGEAQTLRAGGENAHTRCVVRSPRDNIVAVVIGDTIELWDVETKTLVSTLLGDGQTPHCLSFNQDGSRLFSGDLGGMVKVWNLETEEQLLSFQAHEVVDSSIESRTLGVQSLAISPDGKTLATAGANGQVKLWETSFPSRAIAREREIVAEATKVVNERYQRSGSQRAVLEALTRDASLERDVLARAVEIVNARGDRPLAAAPEPEPLQPHLQKIEENLSAMRHAFQELIKVASGTGFDAVNANSPQEVGGQWFWTAWQDIVPQFSLTELEYLLGPLIEAHPEAHQFLCLRGLAYGRDGRWHEAEADLSAALERVPEGTLLWQSYAYPLAFLHVHLGQLDRHRALVEKAVQYFGDTTQAAMAERVAKMCLFSESSTVFVDEATDLAYVAMASLPNSYFRWYSLAAGIAECRRGNWQLAIELLREARGPAGFQILNRTVTSSIFEALAYANLSELELAQESLTEAEQIMNSVAYGEVGGSWWDKLVAETVFAEVKQVLENRVADDAAENDIAVLDGLVAQRVVSPDSQWNWLHPTDGVDPATRDTDFHTTFHAAAYDDSQWKSGHDSPGPEGGFGYGDPVGIELELPPPGLRKTAYFRHRFATDQPYDDLIFSCQLDDGAIVYLDGKEVGRINVADEGKEAYEMLARRTVEGQIEVWVGFYRLTGRLDAGEHVLAFSLHNRAGNTSDLRVAEISLWGTPQKTRAPVAEREATGEE